MTTTVLDPTAATRAVQRELYDKLRELVDGGPVDDLLERVRALATATGRKITRVRKAAKPPRPVEPKPAATPAPVKPAPAVPTRARPAPTAVLPAPRATTRIPRPATAPPRPAPSMSISVPRWPYLLTVILLGVLGVALAITTGSPLAITGTVAAVLAVAGWRRRRRARGAR